jgi:hypothetical protein
MKTDDLDGLSTSRMVQMTCIRKVLHSNLCQDYCDRRFFWVFSVAPGKCRDLTCVMLQTLPSLFCPIHQSSSVHHPMLHELGTVSIIKEPTIQFIRGARGSVVSWGRKVAGSIPDEVTGFFNLTNPSNSTMTLGSTQPLTEISTRNPPGGKGRPTREAVKFTAICEPIV